MDKLFDWLKDKFKQPLSLAFFVLGALLILLGLTTGFEVPGLKQLVPEPSFRWISVVCGVLSVLIAIPIAYRPPAEPIIKRDSETLPVPDDLRKSFAAKRDSFGYGSRQIKILELRYIPGKSRWVSFTRDGRAKV